MTLENCKRLLDHYKNPSSELSEQAKILMKLAYEDMLVNLKNRGYVEKSVSKKS